MINVSRVLKSHDIYNSNIYINPSYDEHCLIRVRTWLDWNPKIKNVILKKEIVGSFIAFGF